MSCRCQCGWPVYSDLPVTVTCPDCGEPIECNGGKPHDIDYSASDCAVRRWPLWATLVRWKATEEDTGVGDTVHRMLGQKGEAFKAWAERLGIPCGCDERRQEWNRLFPYKLLEPPPLTSPPG